MPAGADDSTGAKWCNKCQSWKPLCEFGKHAKMPDGLRACCKVCNAAEAKRWAKENPEKARQVSRNWRAANPERKRQSDSRYREKHRKLNQLRARLRYLEDPDGHRAKRAAWREKNREAYNRLLREWGEANRERLREIKRKWAKANPEKVAAYIRNRRAAKVGAPGYHTAADVAHQLELQEGRCYWCDVPCAERYHVEHVIPLCRGGSNGPENIVISCPGCNWRKGFKLPDEWRNGSR